MSSAAARAYAQAAIETGNPHDIKAQLLLKAATKLETVRTSSEATRLQASEALEYNEKVWALFLNESMNEQCPYPPELRKNMEQIAIFVISHTLALRASRLQLEEFKVLIEINRTIASGLRARA